jgi:hypothetical protein
MRGASVLVAAAVSVVGLAGSGAPPSAPQSPGEGRPPADKDAAGPPAVKKADAKVSRLIGELGADDYRVRERAGRDLTALGEKALPEMRRAWADSDSPEVRQRLAVLIRKIDRERLTAPTRVTLSVKDRTAKQIFAEIARQTGYKIDYSGGGPGDDARHSFEFVDTPFWVAVDRVATAAGCVAGIDSDDATVQVTQKDSLDPYVAYAGPFRFVALRIESSHGVQLSGIPRRGGSGHQSDSQLFFNFLIQSEPKNPMLGVTHVEVLAARDDTGGSLPPLRHEAGRHLYETRGGLTYVTPTSLLLRAPGNRSATTLQSLRVKVGVILQSGRVPEIVIPDPLAKKGQKYVGRTFEVDFAGLNPNPNNKRGYLLEATFRQLAFSDPNRPDYDWVDSFAQKVEVQDEAGNCYQNYGLDNVTLDGNAAQVTIRFNNTDRRTGRPLKLGRPVKLVVYEWLSVIHEVTFEFKDIPLP